MQEGRNFRAGTSPKGTQEKYILSVGGFARTFFSYFSFTLYVCYLVSLSLETVDKL